MFLDTQLYWGLYLKDGGIASPPPKKDGHTKYKKGLARFSPG